ncbi:hypothetical protein FRC02_005272 [Tulasnella sp. 418]|nr:hypothetical protein FRC02_005272 [Tulasnella sp. 418]
MSRAKLTGLIALYLATTYAFATPTPTSQGGTSIPLTRHQRRGLDLTTDEEKSAWLKGMASDLSAKYNGARGNERRKRATGTNALVNFNADSTYYGTIAIGEPAISFNVILDTGSADLWLASADCFQGCTNSINLYDSTESSTFRNLSAPFNIKYGSGAAAGYLGSETVQMAGFTVTNQTFGLVNRITQGLIRDPMSGLMGLAFSTIAASRAVPFWENLVRNSAWDQPLMAFHLTRFGEVRGAQRLEYGGSFDMGFTNQSLYTGDIEYTSIPDGAESYWLIPMTQITVNGAVVDIGSAPLAAIDTGTTLIGGPASVISQIFAQVPNAQPAGPNFEGYYAYPCDTDVTVTLAFGNGRQWSINPQDFILTSLSNGYCVGGFFELDLAGDGSPTWIIGDTFLKNVYSVFRYSPASVGFAQLSETATSLSNIDIPLPSASIGTGNGATVNAATTTRGVASPAAILATGSMLVAMFLGGLMIM